MNPAARRVFTVSKIIIALRKEHNLWFEIRAELLEQDAVRDLPKGKWTYLNQRIAALEDAIMLMRDLSGGGSEWY